MWPPGEDALAGRAANLVGGGDVGAEADAIAAIAISLSCGSSVLAFLLAPKVVVGGEDGAGVSRAAVPASGVFGASGAVTKEKLLGDPGTVPAGSPIVTSGGGGGGGC